MYADGRDRSESTVVVTSVPETTAFIRALVCRDRSRLGGADLAQLPGERWQRSEFESVEFNRRYQLFTLVGQDTQFMYELFSPALISWLCSEVPAGFGFELNGGNLSVAQPGHLEDPEELERLCSLAASLAQRIRTEAMEEGPGSQVFREERALTDLDAAIGEVDWAAPPPTVGAAVDAYRGVALRRAWVLLMASLWALVPAAVIAGVATLIAGPIAGAVVGIPVLAVAFVVARSVVAVNYRFGSVSVQRVGLEAFTREYAHSRGLEIQNRWAFHSDMRGFPMPGVADHVLAGKLPGAGIDGRFVMFGDAPEMRSRGEEMALTADRPLAADGLMVRLPESPGVDPATVAELPEDYRLETRGRDLLVWRPVQGNLIRTAKGSDAFCAKAGRVVQGLASHAGQPPGS